MKKFKFTLQTVHGVRESRQEKEQLILSQLQAETSLALEEIFEIENKRRVALDTYSRRLECGEQIDPLEMELSAKYLVSLDAIEREKRQILAQKKQACARQSAVVAAAAQAVQATAKIRETQRSRHNLELARSEQIALDEMVSVKFARALYQD